MYILYIMYINISINCLNYAKILKRKLVQQPIAHHQGALVCSKKSVRITLNASKRDEKKTR